MPKVALKRRLVFAPFFSERNKHGFDDVCPCEQHNRVPLSHAHPSTNTLLRAARAVIRLLQVRRVAAPLFGAKHAHVAIRHAVRSTHRLVALLRTKHRAPTFAPAFRNHVQVRCITTHTRLLKLTRVPVRLAVRPAHARALSLALHVCAHVLTRCNRRARRFDAHHFLEHARLSRFTAALGAHVGTVRLRRTSNRLIHPTFLEIAALDCAARVHDGTVSTSAKHSKLVRGKRTPLLRRAAGGHVEVIVHCKQVLLSDGEKHSTQRGVGPGLDCDHIPDPHGWIRLKNRLDLHGDHDRVDLRLGVDLFCHTAVNQPHGAARLFTKRARHA
mmetsp:Transcript_11023/g.23642  ORF Transcript_11023/g.23642 Transcript_11023/m.23642 type:complete len:329 (-) Transcript_11023:114-1100(-)